MDLFGKSEEALEAYGRVAELNSSHALEAWKVIYPPQTHAFSYEGGHSTTLHLLSRESERQSFDLIENLQ